jgi:competence protein ComEC
LRSLGVKKLDVVVISHPHADHFAGVLQALDGGLQVATLVDHVQVEPGGSRAPPGQSDSDEAGEYLRLRRLLAQRGCRYVLAGTGATLTVDALAVRCFAPTKPLVMLDGYNPWKALGGTPSGDALNSASLVTLLSVGAIDVLLPGDAEAEVLADYDLPAAEVLVVPHHGSRGAVSAALLKKLDLRAALVSVGRDNSFGHPDASTVSLLAQNVAIVVRTDTAGWVSCRVTGEELAMTSERTPTR